MYKIVRRTPVVVTDESGHNDVTWATEEYGEYFSQPAAEEALKNLTNVPKYDVTIEYEPTVEELVNSDYLD